MKEDAFIFNAARLHLAEGNIAALKELAGSGLDWSAVAKKISSHGVSQFIYYALKQHDLTALLPEELLKRFQAEYYDTAIRNAKLLEAFKEIVSILQNKVIPLKGIELIQRLYPNIAIRSMCDIDLLVEQDCVEESWKRLRLEGYESFFPLHAVKKSEAHGELPETCLHLPKRTGRFFKQISGGHAAEFGKFCKGQRQSKQYCFLFPALFFHKIHFFPPRLFLRRKRSFFTCHAKNFHS